MPTPPPSQDEWKQRIGPLLSTSLREASERITSHPSVQSWLHEASFEVTHAMRGGSDMQGQAQAHGRMLDALEARFAPLVAAVQALTEGCGRLDLHWRPLEPNYSRIYIDFGRGYTVDVFYRLDALTPDEAHQALHVVKTALPRGEPFPNRPNTATGLAGHAGTCIGIRYSDQLDEQGARRQRITLLPPDGEPVKHRAEERAARALLDLFERALD